MPVTITYPRPLTERAVTNQVNIKSTEQTGLRGFTHTEWDKWISGEVWYPEIGVKGGYFPYKIELSAGAPSGTTYASTIGDDTGRNTGTSYLRLYNANIAAGTYTFTIYVTDSALNRTSVDVSLTVYAANDANILDHFRICDFGAGTNGTGTQASPHNTFIGANVDGNPTLWGTDYNVVMAPNAIVILKGTKTLTDLSTGFSNAPSAQNWALGGGANPVGALSTRTRPRQLMGAWGAAITFDLTAAARSINLGTGDVWDAMLKNVTVSGQRADPLVTPSSAVPQVSWGGRSRLHDVTFKNMNNRDPSSANIGCFGSDGEDAEVRKMYSTFIGLTFDNIIASNSPVNANLWVVFAVRDVLVDLVTVTNCGNAGTQTLGKGLQFKHGSIDSEIRRVTALGGFGIANTVGLIVPGDGGGLNGNTGCIIRFNNIDVGQTNPGIAMAANQTSGTPYSVHLEYNTHVGRVRVNQVDGDGLGNSLLTLYRNIIENGTTAPGLTNSTDTTPISSDWTITVTEQLNGAVGSLVDNSGVVLVPANAAYGHSLPKAA
jgi:hypothetical protein